LLGWELLTLVLWASSLAASAAVRQRNGNKEGVWKAGVYAGDSPLPQPRQMLWAMKWVARAGSAARLQQGNGNINTRLWLHWPPVLLQGMVAIPG
jgi:hypothetical protein